MGLVNKQNSTLYCEYSLTGLVSKHFTSHLTTINEIQKYDL